MAVCKHAHLKNRTRGNGSGCRRRRRRQRQPGARRRRSRARRRRRRWCRLWMLGLGRSSGRPPGRPLARSARRGVCPRKKSAALTSCSCCINPAMITFVRFGSPATTATLEEEEEEEEGGTTLAVWAGDRLLGGRRNERVRSDRARASLAPRLPVLPLSRHISPLFRFSSLEISLRSSPRENENPRPPVRRVSRSARKKARRANGFASGLDNCPCKAAPFRLSRLISPPPKQFFPL